jgi:hypothetical protein
MAEEGVGAKSEEHMLVARTGSSCGGIIFKLALLLSGNYYEGLG